MDYNNRVMSKDLYQIMGIARNANDREIRAAYRTLAKKFHPDAGGGASPDRFREIQAAYEILGDPDRRSAYDRHCREQAQRPAPGYQSEWTRSRPEVRMDPAHIDLSTIFSHARPEPIGRRRGQAAAGTYRNDPWEELEAIFRILERFQKPDR